MRRLEPCEPAPIDYFERTIGSAIDQFEAITEATSISDLLPGSKGAIF